MSDVRVNATTTIDQHSLSDDERMRLLRAEEFEALGMWEIPNNELLSHRLSPVVSTEARIVAPSSPRPPPSIAKAILGADEARLLAGSAKAAVLA